MREKLIELLEQCDKHCDEITCEECPYDEEKFDCGNPLKADYLIANGVTISDSKKGCTERTTALNFEAEYERVMEELAKAKYEINYMRDELNQAERTRMWFLGMKETLEVVFGRKFNQ